MTQINWFHDKFRFLSNFYPCAIEWEGLLYPSVENAYQASKTLNDEEREKFQGLFPGEAKREGRKLKIRDDWEAVKIDVMEQLLRIKFSSQRMRNRLLATAGCELVEGNNWGDKFWGKVGDEGENHLGRLLMKIREEMLAEISKANEQYDEPDRG